MIRCTLKSFCVTTVFLLAFSSPVLAQGIASGSAELNGNVGFSSLKGVDNDHHAVFGFSGLYNLNPTVAVGFEYNYQMMGSETIAGVTGTEHLQLFGPVARFSLTQSSRVVPYALVAVGGASLHAVASANNLSISASQSGFYFGFGGGATFYAGTNWGIRPEFRYERQQFSSTSIDGYSVGSFGQNDAQGSVALFYQFGGKRRSKN
jgi:opacity protein-like surface antigen